MLFKPSFEAFGVYQQPEFYVGYSFIVPLTFQGLSLMPFCSCNVYNISDV
jgi:hypothetical protein